MIALRALLFRLFMLYLTTLLLSQNIYRRMISSLMDNELEMMRQEAAVA
jgi:hypothetical protein